MGEPAPNSAGTPAGKWSRREPIRLHLGGTEPREGWKIFDIQERPGVDYVGNVMDLSVFADGTVTEVYVSHVYEHLDYASELEKALREAHRVLVPGGLLRAGVPDLDALSKLFIDPSLSPDDRFHVMRMMFGGQIDATDYHRIGLNFEFFSAFLRNAGFTSIRRVKSFDLFKDCTALVFRGVPISLNVIALK